MLNIRTDLALEAHQLLKDAKETTLLEGVISREYQRDGFKVTHVEVKDGEGAREIGKPAGNYSTVELSGFFRREEDGFIRAVKAVSEEISAMLPLQKTDHVMVAGLGNRNITPDAIGSKAGEYLMVTRHLIEKMPESFGAFRPVSSLSPGVLGLTGVETAEILRGVINNTQPLALIVVDALASMSLDRLCNTVQIADTGIVPGSGVGNSRTAINKDALGIPVIAIGVPTVVDAGTLAAEIMGENEEALQKDRRLSPAADMMVTPKDIDAKVNDISKVIGYAINFALHEGITLEDVDMFI